MCQIDYNIFDNDAAGGLHREAADGAERHQQNAAAHQGAGQEDRGGHAEAGRAAARVPGEGAREEAGHAGAGGGARRDPGAAEAVLRHGAGEGEGGRAAEGGAGRGVRRAGGQGEGGGEGGEGGGGLGQPRGAAVQEEEGEGRVAGGGPRGGQEGEGVGVRQVRARLLLLRAGQLRRDGGVRVPLLRARVVPQGLRGREDHARAGVVVRQLPQAQGRHQRHLHEVLLQVIQQPNTHTQPLINSL